MTSLCSIFAGSEQPIDNSSGGGQSDDMKCSYGYSSHRGRRPTMEDFYQAVFVKSCNITVGLFGVFDGHGGPRVADFVCKNLFNNLIQNPQFISNTKNAIVEAFQQTDSEFLETESNTEHEYDAGSTASTAVLVGDRLLVANVGDSRAVACRDGKAVALSIDHKPDHEDERQRIEEAGGIVSWAGTWRVDGILAVSRAFGDKSLKQYVVADPDIKEEMVTNGVDFIIVASDGLWDVVSNEEAISMVQSISDAEEAAKMLTEEAFHRGSNDNITCIVVHFHNRG